MRGSLILSILLHVAIIAIIWLGPPSFSDPMVEPVQIIDVAVVTEIRQQPDEAVPPKPEPEPKKAPPEPPKPPKTASLPKPPPPAPPPPPPEPAAKPEPKQPVEPEPAQEPVSVPIPKEVPKPKPEPKPEPKEVAQPEPSLAPQPRRKPKPPPQDDFASVLKTVEKLKRDQPKPEPKPKKDEPTFEEQLSDVLNKHARLDKPKQPAPLGPKMSMSEIDALRRQIERCWNPPAGAPEAENLVVEVKLAINPDGTVRHTRIVDTARMSRDPFYRAAAESVRRAIKSPLCTPLKLPLDKYELWKDTTLRFDPRELVGR